MTARVGITVRVVVPFIYFGSKRRGLFFWVPAISLIYLGFGVILSLEFVCVPDLS